MDIGPVFLGSQTRPDRVWGPFPEIGFTISGKNGFHSWAGEGLWFGKEKSLRRFFLPKVGPTSILQNSTFMFHDSENEPTTWQYASSITHRPNVLPGSPQDRRIDRWS